MSPIFGRAFYSPPSASTGGTLPWHLRPRQTPSPARRYPEETSSSRGFGIDTFGPGKISGKADGSALAYGMRTDSRISQIDADPPYGSIGEQLPVVEHAAPNLVAWGPTAATKDQYLCSSKDEPVFENIEGIYLNPVGDASGGTQLVPIGAYYGAEVVYDIEWLPDGSGCLFSKRYVDSEIYADIFEYSFATKEITRLTVLPDDAGRPAGVRSHHRLRPVSTPRWWCARGRSPAGFLRRCTRRSAQIQDCRERACDGLFVTTLIAKGTGGVARHL